MPIHSDSFSGDWQNYTQTSMRKLDKYSISLSGEYAVASELCRRGIYANLTLGNLKRTDLLAFADEGKVVRIEVKSKQGREWASVKGIPEGNNFLVFVDFNNTTDTERPDFYVLSPSDWRKCMHRKRRERAKKGLTPIEISTNNAPIFPKEIQKNGKPRVGMTVPLAYIEKEKDQWEKLIKCVSSG